MPKHMGDWWEGKLPVGDSGGPSGRWRKADFNLQVVHRL